jgi:hypothetical protein
MSTVLARATQVSHPRYVGTQTTQKIVDTDVFVTGGAGMGFRGDNIQLNESFIFSLLHSRYQMKRLPYPFSATDKIRNVLSRFSRGKLTVTVSSRILRIYYDDPDLHISNS